MIADLFHAQLHAAAAFRRLIPCTDLAVIEQVFAAHIGGREVGHDDIGARQDPQFPPPGVDGSQGRGGRQQDAGVHEADDGQKMQGVLQGPGLLVPEGGGGMGDEGTDPDHVGLEFLHKKEIVQQVVDGLKGTSDHHPAADLKSDLTKIPQAAHTVFNGQVRRVQHPVVVRVYCLVPEQVALRPGPEKGLIALPGPLSDGEGHRAVGVPGPDLRDQVADPLIRIIRVLSPLQDQGPKAQPVAVFTAAKDPVPVQAVAVRLPVGPADAAVIAVVFTIVRKLDQAAQVDLPAVFPAGCLRSFLVEVSGLLPGQGLQQGPQVLPREGAVPLQPVDPVKILWIAHGLFPYPFRICRAGLSLPAVRLLRPLRALSQSPRVAAASADCWSPEAGSEVPLCEA